MRKCTVQKIRHLLATDLDGTFVGSKKGLNDLMNYYKEMEERIALIYITGRHYHSAIQLIKEENLPHPDVLISDVGVAIWTGRELREDVQWSEKMKNQWVPETVITIAKSIPGIIRQEVPNERRVSYFTKGVKPANRFRGALQNAKIPHTFIFSSGRDIDILPPKSGKGEALKYVLTTYVEPGGDMLIAGDSGNDLNMLTIGYPAVIVSNAQEELRSITGHSNIYKAKKPYANGILEAWKYFYEKKEKKKKNSWAYNL